jgi:hypothetical protein
MKPKHIYFLFLTILAFNSSICLFAGKEEIRVLLSKQAVTKYGNGEMEGESLLLASGITPWKFEARPTLKPNAPIRGELARALGFKEILMKEGILDVEDCISPLGKQWIKEVLSEWIDLTDVNIVYGKFQFGHPSIEGSKILYSIGLNNLSLEQAYELQRRSGWIQ